MSFLVVARSASCYEDEFFWWIPWQSESVCSCLSWQSVCCLPWQSVSSVWCLPWQSSGVFHDNPSIPSSVFHEILLLSSMTIFYELFWRQSFVVLCGSPLSYSGLFCILLFAVSSSEDSLLLSCVAVRCLTLSSSVFFSYASFAAWVSFFRRWLFFRHFHFADPTSLRGFYFMQFQTQGFVILHLEFEGRC